MSLKPSFVTGCLAWAIVLLVALGGASLYLSYLPFEFVKAKIDSLAPDGRADPFHAAFFKQIVVRLRISGITLFLAGGLCYLMRRRMQQQLCDLLPSLFTSSLSLRRELTYAVIERIKKEDKIHLSVFCLILLFGISMRLLFLFQPMRYDEAVTFIYYASRPFYIALSNYYSPNNHIFHTLLVRIAYLLFGNHPWVIRLPALCAGILLVPASYMVTRIFYNKDAALLTAGLIASSSAFIEYSTNARGYTLLCLLFLLILALGTYLKKNENTSGWLLFALLSATGFYTIPIMLFPFGVVVIWLLLSVLFKDTPLDPRLFLKDLFVSLIVVVLLTGMLYVPVFVTFGSDAMMSNRFESSTSWSNFVRQFPLSLRSIWDLWNRDVPTGISLLLLIGFLTSLVFHKRLTLYRVPIVLAVAIWCIPILIVFIVQRVVPFNRRSLFLLPLYAGIASSGVVCLLRPVASKMFRYWPLVFGILTLALSVSLGMNVIRTQSLYYSEETGLLREAEPMTLFLKGYLRSGDGILATTPSDAPLGYYFNLHGVPLKYLYADLSESRRIFIIVNESHHQTLTGLLKSAGLSTNDLSVPKLIRQYPFASLYEINKQDE